MISQMHDPELKEKVLETEKKCEGLVPTYDRHWISGEGADAKFDKERTKLHKEIMKQYVRENMGKNAINENGEAPTLTLLGGRGGSGKSSFAGLVYDKDKVLVVDSDKIKELIPEYKGWNAVQVHEESSVIMKKIIRNAQRMNVNVVIDQTMSSSSSSLKYLDDFKSKGYRTEAHYMYAPPQTSAHRAMTRFRNDKIDPKTKKVIQKGKYDGRFVPTKILLNMKDNERVFDNVKSKVDNWSFYSSYATDTPKLIAKKK